LSQNHTPVDTLLHDSPAHPQVGVQLLLLYMLYFFTGMLLRESVLKVSHAPMHCASVRGVTSCSVLSTKSDPVVTVWNEQVNGSRIRGWWMMHHVVSWHQCLSL
jgi:hypothetical protein